MRKLLPRRSTRQRLRRKRLASFASSRPEIAAVLLFGSHGTPWETPLSDVDLAVLFDPGFQADPGVLLALEGALLEEAGLAEGSVVNLNAAPVLLQHRVLQEGRLVYLRDPVVLADFAESVFRRHGDFVEDHRRFLADFDGTLRERYGGA